jgi:hypothetical protein
MGRLILVYERGPELGPEEVLGRSTATGGETVSAGRSARSGWKGRSKSSVSGGGETGGEIGGWRGTCDG